MNFPSWQQQENLRQFGPGIQARDPSLVSVERVPYIHPKVGRVSGTQRFSTISATLDNCNCNYLQVLPTHYYDTVLISTFGSVSVPIEINLELVGKPGRNDVTTPTTSTLFPVPDLTIPAQESGNYNFSRLFLPFGNIPFCIHLTHNLESDVPVNIRVTLMNLGRRSVFGGNGIGFNMPLGCGTATTGTLPSAISNLELWLRADSISAADGSALATWPDNSGFARDASQPTVSQRPTYNLNQSSTGLPEVAFNGLAFPNDSEMSGTLPVIASATGFTTFAYVNQVSNTVVQVLWNDGAGGVGGGFIQLIVDDFTFNKIGWRDFGGTRLISPAITGNQRLIYTFDRVNSVGKVYRNGVLLGSDVYTYHQLDIGTYTIGANQANNAPFKGKIAEFGLYSKLCSAAEVAGLDSYLANKWGN